MFFVVWTYSVHTAITQWLLNKTSTLCFVFYCFMLSIIPLPGTQHKLAWHWRFSTALRCFCHVLTAVSCQVGLPPHRALQEAGSQSSCHGSTGGTEALVAPWCMTSAPSPFTLAYHKPTDRRLHPPTLEDHSNTAKAVPTKGPPILRKPFKTTPLQTCQTRLHPAL